jgi:hypothetical protein
MQSFLLSGFLSGFLSGIQSDNICLLTVMLQTFEVGMTGWRLKPDNFLVILYAA